MSFRWPLPLYDIALAIEVAKDKPEKPSDWDKIGEVLSKYISSKQEKVVSVKGRGCRERMDRLIAKYKEEDTKSLKRSGTEEEYDELQTLLEDIVSYRRDTAETKEREKASKKKKEDDDKKKGEEMRKAAVDRLARPKKKRSYRCTRKSATDVLATKYADKAKAKDKELDLRRMELEFQQRKYEEEAKERKQRMELEMEERRAMIALLK